MLKAFRCRGAYPIAPPVQFLAVTLIDTLSAALLVASIMWERGPVCVREDRRAGLLSPCNWYHCSATRLICD